MNLNLELQSFASGLNVERRSDVSYIYDPIRKNSYVLQPEEMVRQCIISFLLKRVKISKNLIRVEKGIKVNGLFRRSDIIIYDRNALPLMIIEVKKPSHPVNQKVLNQVAMYNIPLRVPFLMVSNGVDTYLCQCFHENNSYEFLDSFPSYEVMLRS